MVFVDELHFFSDAVATVHQWYLAGIDVVCTTVDKDSVGNDLIIGKVRSAGTPVTIIQKYGTCGVPDCSEASSHSSRITAVGSGWMGGAESYTPTCGLHHALLDIFNNPGALIASTGWWKLHGAAIIQALGVTSAEFCQMTNAAVVAL